MISFLLAVSIMMMAFPLIAPPVSAVNEQLHPTGTKRCDGIVHPPGALYVNTEYAYEALTKTGGIWGENSADTHEYDRYPGYVTWGNQTGENIAETRDVGTVELWMSDPTIRAPYYRVSIYAEFEPLGWKLDEYGLRTFTLDYPTGYEYVSVRLGVGSGYKYWQASPNFTNIAGDTSGPDYNNGQKVWALNLENWAEGRPWTAEEVDNMYIVIEMRWDLRIWDYLPGYIKKGPGYPVSLALYYVDMIATPATDYEPPTPPSTDGPSWVLRPNADHAIGPSWSSTKSNYFSAINETTHYGDSGSSEISGAWVSQPAYFQFTDLPSGFSDSARFKVKLWVIARETVDTIYSRMELFIAAKTGYWLSKSISLYYTNYTTEHLYWSGDVGWTYEQVNNIIAGVWIYWYGPGPPSGACNITQMGLIVTLASDVAPSPPPLITDNTAWHASFGSWIPFLFGAVGFFGLFFYVPFAYLQWRESREDVFPFIVRTFVMVVVFFGLFSIWLIGR